MATQPRAGDVQVYDEASGTPYRPLSGLTYQDLLEMFPEEDLVRRELIYGELIVTASPVFRHQKVVARLIARLVSHVEERRG